MTYVSLNSRSAQMSVRVPIWLHSGATLCGESCARMNGNSAPMHAVSRLLLYVGIFLSCMLINPIARAQTPANDRMQELVDANETLYLDALRALNEKRFNDAESLLTLLIKQAPQHGGAYLDLAILYCELGNQEESDRLFAMMKTSLPLAPEQVDKLNRLRPTQCRTTRKPWQFLFNVDVGWDSNLNQGAANPYFTFNTGVQQVTLELLPEYQARSAQYHGASMTSVYGFNRDRTHVFAQWRSRRFAELSKFNNSSLIVGIDHPLSQNPFFGSVNIAVSGLNLGNKLYQKQATFNWRAPIWKFSQDQQLVLSAGIQNSTYPTQTNFDARSNELKFLFQSNHATMGWNVGVGYIQDKAKYARQGGDRSGWNTQLGLRQQINDAWSLEAQWNWQTWKSSTVYSPGLIELKRDQTSHHVRMAANYQINPSQSVIVEARAIRNRENITILEYNARQFQAAWQWQF